MEAGSAAARKSTDGGHPVAFRTSSKQYSTRGSSQRRQKEASAGGSESVLPAATKTRLNAMFRGVEKEFEAMYLENCRLRERVAHLEKGQDTQDEKDRTVEEPDAFEAMLKTFSKKNALKTRHKLKAQTNKIVSSFKAPVQSASLVQEYKGHRDGIWDVAVSSVGHPLIGTASADRTARIWGVDSGKCLMSYVGHTGSVNAISFHPAQDLALTASGDGTAHVWKADTIAGGGGGNGSSDESGGAESSEEDFRGAATIDPVGVRMNVVQQPMVTLMGHQNVVIGCRWLDNEHAVTASWDKMANLYNVETGTLLQTLAGHDDELTHVACHPTKRLVATSSVDTTFRLWDFRETIHSVSVFQGHTEAVTCAAFSRSDQIVSGSDDRTVKVWDLRNMRSPVTNIQTPSAVNRLSVSQNGTIAIPHDNRQVVLYDLSGVKILRLPRDSSSKSHHRMVTSTCWAPGDSSDQWRSKANLFSAGFDRMAFGWWVRPASRDKEDGYKMKDKSKEGTF